MAGEPRPPRSQRLAYPFIRAFALTLLALLGPFRVQRKRNLPAGGVLVVANHISDLDPIAVQGASRRHVFFMAKEELFTMKFVGWVLRWWRAFPVKRGEPDRAALKHAIALLKSGACVCVFPEGRLSPTGELQEILPGAALLARQEGVRVIACGLKRTNRVLPYGKLVPRPALGWVTARWGEPTQFDKQATTEEIVAWIESELKRLTA